jgi:ribosomal protein S12 methylthiotransferase accessory factor
MYNTERDKLRLEVARKVNSLSREELLKDFAISRVANITGLDIIGVPVFTTVRALSKTIAIHGGKGLDPAMCRAGAIIEAIEFEVAEQRNSKAIMAQAFQIPEEERLAIEDCFPARSSIVTEFTPMAWETATNIQNGQEKLMPSDLIWMIPRIKEQPLLYLQTGSNGLAGGGSLEDAILSGLYEILERDAWTLNQFILDNCGCQPRRVPLISLPEPVEALVRKIENAKLKLHLFDCTNDYRVPAMSAMILDFTGNCAGTFAGYGCHLNAEIAAIRAITEAIQGRACYIAGARDDMFRRQFLLMKGLNHKRLDQMFNDIPATSPLSEYRTIQFEGIKEELRYLLRLIKAAGVSEVYVKELGAIPKLGLKIVRVFSPQCEPFKFDFWQPTLRCLSYAKRKLAELAKQRKEKVTEPEEEDEEEGEDPSESWKNA